MIKTAVFPVAGKGTRFLPVTKSIPKEMIPLVDVPILHYVVKEAVDSGVEKLIFINAKNKRSIIDYFKRNYELEKFLEIKGRNDLIDLIRDLSENIEIIEVIQEEQLGLGHAVKASKELIKKHEFFSVLLGDEVIYSEVPAIKQINETAKEFNAPTLGVIEVPKDEVYKYGVIDGESVSHKGFKISKMVEKPKVEVAPSNLITPGRYIFNYDIFNYLDKTSKGTGGEYQLTDAINAQAKNERFYGHLIVGDRFDTGTPLGYMEASLDFGLKRPGMKENILKMMNEKIKKYS